MRSRFLTPQHLQAIGHVFDHPAVRQQAKVLEDHADLVAAHLAQLGLVHLQHIAAVEQHLAVGRVGQARDAAHQRGFAAAGKAHHHERFATLYLERDAAHRDDMVGLLLRRATARG